MSEESAAMHAALQRCRTTFKVTVFRKGTTKQVLFLEAGKDFVDTLFSFLLLPVGTILHILSRGIQVKPNIGGIWGIFESVDSSILHIVDKQDLLQPRPAAVGCTCGSNTKLKIQRDLEAANIIRSPPQERLVLPQEYFKCTCRKCSNTFLSSDRGERCEPCKSEGYTGHFCEGPYSAQKDTGDVKEVDLSKGFVKENIKFLVTDKLQIMPSSTVTIMSMLKRMEVVSVDDPESNEIIVGITQILQLLHSALRSNTCLNDVFALQKTEVRQRFSCSSSTKVTRIVCTSNDTSLVQLRKVPKLKTCKFIGW